MSRSILIIQTAFTGDAILMTSLAEKLHEKKGSFIIDVLIRKGNETLFSNHPFIRDVLVWDKKRAKYKNLFTMLGKIRQRKYDMVINLQRFASTGFLTAFSLAKEKIGFDKNPLSFLFTRKIKHTVIKGLHEIERYHKAISDLTDDKPAMPRIYPSPDDFQSVQKYKKGKYITIAPVSAWFTKTLPAYKWIELITNSHRVNPEMTYILIGSKEEFNLSEEIKKKSRVERVINLCGSISFLESAALMKDAETNYVNDSAPLHLAGAMNAPVTVIYCSTVPEFGFGPLSDNSKIIETKFPLDCRPCGLHGYRECPLIHFKCAHTIEISHGGERVY